MFCCSWAALLLNGYSSVHFIFQRGKNPNTMIGTNWFGLTTASLHSRFQPRELCICSFWKTAINWVFLPLSYFFFVVSYTPFLIYLSCIGVWDLLKLHSLLLQSTAFSPLSDAACTHWASLVFCTFTREPWRVENSNPLQSFSKTDIQSWLLKVFIIAAS